MHVDHVAIPAAHLQETVRWYIQTCNASVLYQDETWAFLQVGGSKIALVTPGQHPPHLAFALTREQLAESAARHGKPIRTHRDGTESFYLHDPSGNAVEFIAYPEGHAYQNASFNPDSIGGVTPDAR